MISRILVFLALAIASLTPAVADEGAPALDAPHLVLRGVDFTVTAKPAPADAGEWRVRAGEKTYSGESADGALTFKIEGTQNAEIALALVAPDGTEVASETRSTLPGWISLLPAIVAIAAVLLLRQVIPSLTLGIWVGAMLAYGLNPWAPWYGFLDILPVYLTKALTDADHVAIILFTVMIGGLIGILTHNGGMAGIAQAVAKLASNARRAQGATSILGLAVFFDDYANALIVGNTMRPITDRVKVSREKLAYIVDSTAAPVSTLAIVTTWIGFMVSEIGKGLDKIGDTGLNPYGVFLDSLLFSFYPILAIILVWFVAASGRDFGPMLKAERNARQAPTRDAYEIDDDGVGDEAVRIGGPAKPNLWLAVIPLATLVFGTLAGVVITGMIADPEATNLRDIFGSGNSFSAMMWASFGAVVVAMALSLLTGRMNFEGSSEAWLSGARSMMLPAVVLSLAWSIGNVNETVQTADYLISMLSDSISPFMLPALVFVLSAAMAFTTGTSWGVMAIVLPLVVPLSWVVLGGAEGLEGTDAAIFSATIAGVLSGAVWGDHCSPISDTTVMSSVASGCDHAEHVRTQIPYAMLGGITSILVGLVPIGLGVPWWIALPASIAVMIVIFRAISSPVEEAS